MTTNRAEDMVSIYNCSLKLHTVVLQQTVVSSLITKAGVAAHTLDKRLFKSFSGLVHT